LTRTDNAWETARLAVARRNNAVEYRLRRQFHAHGTQKWYATDQRGLQTEGDTKQIEEGGIVAPGRNAQRAHQADDREGVRFSTAAGYA
jgi:hypothetical protein